MLPSVNSAMVPAARHSTAESTTCFGRPATGIARSISVPLHGIDRPNTTSATMIARKGKPSCRPLVGNQSYCKTSFVISDWSMPIASPATTVAENEVIRPRSAAPSAGTMKSVNDVGLRPEIGVMRIPAKPASTVATIQLIAPSRVDE